MQESETSAAERSALEHFDAVDVSFDDSGIPGQGGVGDDRRPVAVDAGCEGVEARQILSADCVEPLEQPSALSLGEDLGAGTDMSGMGFQCGAVSADGLAPLLFDLTGRRRGTGRSSMNRGMGAVSATSSSRPTAPRWPRP